LVVGAVAGLLARKIIGGTSPFGFIGDMLLGIAGGIVGGYLMALVGLGNTTGGLIATIITATIGAVFLIWTTKFLKKS
jgi:uncharacterized membrane protein YeaQ/YmgE (transglycosylase-associated protein family)